MEGFVEFIASTSIRGWAFDPDAPDSHVKVEFYCGEKSLGFAVADGFRNDLKTAGKGRGDHAFVFYFPKPIPKEDLPMVTARVTPSSGDERLLPRHQKASATPPAKAVVFQGQTQNVSQHPVFILGSARSGTSALVQAIRTQTHYRGRNEGQVLDLLWWLQSDIARFYERKAQLTGYYTSLREIPQKYFQDGIAGLFVTALRELLPDDHWVDKTPIPEMIQLVPRLLEIWPNARFIFMKRRAIENLLSRGRKFRNLNFANAAREWSRCMQAWLAVRDKLEGRGLEIDHLCLVRSPRIVAEHLATLMQLSPQEMEKIESFLMREQPERTAGRFGQIHEFNLLDWSAENKAEFAKIVGPMMTAFGYTMDETYCESSLIPSRW